MAEWWPFDRSWGDELKRNWTEVLNMSSAAAQSLGLPQPGILPGDPFTAIVDAARTALIGKKRTLPFSGRDLTLVLTDISVQGPDLARLVGQYGHVRITALDVQWGGYQLERMEIQARNVHLRPGTRPTLVVAPVLVEGFVSAPAASRWLASVSTRIELILRALHLADWRVSLRSPAFHVPLPVLPDGMTLTSVEPAPGGFLVKGMLSEWQRSLSRDDIERLLAAMRAGKDRLDI